MDPVTVLLVDDEEPILKSLQRTLRKEPYRILTANSGEEGLAVVAAHKVDMVVSDQRMPGMTGSQFLQKVKEMCPDTVRIVLSGYAEPQIIVEAINNGGVYRYLGKPWDDEELKTTLRQCIEHHQVLQENRRLSELSAAQIKALGEMNLRLESAVQERTHSLRLSQDVLETLPRMVLGICRDGELVLSNGAARRHLPGVAASLPGTEITEVLPEAAVEIFRRCLSTGLDATCTLAWDDLQLKAHAALLGEPEAPRGCVLLLESVT